ncbi:triosephosphate isomerase [Oxobacter pfennigii]|uniref:Triosephosphate isomerase n=1 Tax=Oxobacter pfennigii TaxID=36849 RepID=A0A0P8WC06_9CLOT|nr:triose-phosphate isomerase [Oxobacter pfennigii]KPU45247.1 triosephosphate isomerase [Oxobacter pfennigii]
MRTPIIAGNWKMHKTLEESLELVKGLKDEVSKAKCQVVVCPTFLSLAAVVQELKGTNIDVGAQNMHFEDQGAYTGEISPVMLKHLGVKYVIIGHSERRQYFAETDDMVNKKVLAAYKHGLIPIVCVGETLNERESNSTFEIIGNQIKKGLANLTSEQIEELIVAYEPIWAIGTGKTATAQDANSVIKYIRDKVAQMYGKESAEKMRIQYGGSVKPSTIKEQMAQSDIDGALVGGASLKVDEFAAIVNF